MRLVIAEIYDLHLSSTEVDALWHARQAMAKIRYLPVLLDRNITVENLSSLGGAPYTEMLQRIIEHINAVQPAVTIFDEQAHLKGRAPFCILAFMDSAKYGDQGLNELTYHDPQDWV